MTSVVRPPASLRVANDNNTHPPRPVDQPRKRGRRSVASRDPAFAENLKRLRHRDGYTQEQLDDALDLAHGTIAKWERQHLFPNHAGQLRAIAALFSVTVDDLLNPDATFSSVAAQSATSTSSAEWRRFILDLLTELPGHIEINFWAANQTGDILPRGGPDKPSV